MNSCVPKAFDSVTPPQLGLRVTARSWPMPFRQWYSSAKHPPGHRTFGTLSALSAATTSLRMPRVLGIWRVGTHPDALVDALAEMLRELAEEVAVDLRAGLGGVDGQRNRLGGLCRGRNGSGGQQREAEDESSAAGDEAGSASECLSHHSLPDRTGS